MRIVVIDPFIPADSLGDQAEWITPLEGHSGRWPAVALGYIALVAERHEPEPDGFVVPFNLPANGEASIAVDRGIGAGLRLGWEIRGCGLATPIVITDRRRTSAGPGLSNRELPDRAILMEEPWTPAEIVQFLTESRPSSQAGASKWQGFSPGRPPDTDIAQEAIPFLQQLVQMLGLVETAEKLAGRTRDVASRLMLEGSSIPGADIVLTPVLENLEASGTFPWNEDPEHWFGLMDYCAKNQLHLWAQTSELGAAARDLFTHDIKSLVAAMPLLLRLRLRVPKWDVGFIDGNAESVYQFADRVTESAEAVAAGASSLVQVLNALRDHVEANPEIESTLNRVGRDRSGGINQAPICSWVLIACAETDPWHTALPPIISNISKLNGSACEVVHANTIAELEEVLLERLPHPSTQQYRLRPKPGLILIGEHFPDGSGLEFINRIWDRIDEDDEHADWLMANYVHFTSDPDTIHRVQDSRYSKLIRLILKTPDTQIIQQRIDALLKAPAGAAQAVAAIQIWDETRQPLRVEQKKKGPDGELIWEARSSRELAMITVWGIPIFLTAWGFEIVRALKINGGKGYRDTISGLIYDRYQEWSEDFDGLEFAPMARDEFIEWFAKDDEDSLLDSQIKRINNLASSALIEEILGDFRERSEAFNKPTIVSRHPRGSLPEVELLCGAEIISEPSEMSLGSLPTRSPKVVLVEDDPHWVELMSGIVRKITGSNPTTYFGKSEALRSIEENGTDVPSLYILDVRLETQFSGLELFQHIIAKDESPEIIIVTIEQSDIAYTMLPHCRAPREFDLPSGLGATEVIRRTRPAELFKWESDFVERLENQVRVSLQAAGDRSSTEILAHIRMPMNRYRDDISIEIQMPDDSIVTIPRVDKKYWALIKVMAGWNPGIWMTEHKITSEIFSQVLNEAVPEDWNFSQTFRSNSGLRQTLAKAGLFEVAGTGSCLYRLKADVMTAD